MTGKMIRDVTEYVRQHRVVTVSAQQLSNGKFDCVSSQTDIVLYGVY